MKLHDLQKQFMQAVHAPAAHDLSIDVTDLSTRLQIYHESSLGGRLKALKNIFPCTQRIVGEKFFQQMAAEFLTLQPSIYLTSDAQGAHFPVFIRDYQPVESLPYITDLAKLEWLWYQVFHDAAHKQFMQSSYPVTALWKMAQPEYQGDFVLPVLSEPLRVMLFQREQRIHMLHLTQQEWDENQRRPYE